jgi:hypothetical protein
VIIPDGFGTATFRYRALLNGQTCTFSFGYAIDPNVSVTAEAGEIDSNWILSVPVSLLNADWEYGSVYILRNRDDVFESADQGAAVVGTRANPSPSPAVSVGVTKHTAQAGKEFRGRAYLPSGFITEGDLNAIGQMDATELGDLQTAIDEFPGRMTGDGLPLQLLHSDPLTAPTSITGLTVRSFVRTQRRRQKLV